MSSISRNSSKILLGNKCQECGCHCDSCVNNNSIHLHQEIESLKQRLSDRESQIMSMESQILMHANQFPNGEMHAVRENLYFWQEKYDRLLESYRKLQKVNQGLEDKLLRIADKFENEKIALSQNVNDLSNKLTQAQASIVELQQETEKYKNDCNLAIRLLQCKPSQFISQKLDSFPNDIQERAQQYLNYRRPSNNNEDNNGRTGGKLIRVPIPTFPPTAVIYSLNKEEKPNEDTNSNEKNTATNYVSAAIMAKILQERENERISLNKCVNCYNKELYNTSMQTNDKKDFSISMDQPSQTSSNSSTTSTSHNNTMLQSHYTRNSNSKHSNNETIII